VADGDAGAEALLLGEGGEDRGQLNPRPL